MIPLHAKRPMKPLRQNDFLAVSIMAWINRGSVVCGLITRLIVIMHCGSKNWSMSMNQEMSLRIVASHLQEDCCTTFASTSEKWYRPLLSYPQCTLHVRTKYIGGGTRPPKGSVVTYFGIDLQSSVSAFSGLGAVSIPLTPAIISIMSQFGPPQR